MPSATTYSDTVTEKKITVRGLDIQLYVAGNPAGNTLFFIHGSSVAATIWRAQLADAALLQAYQLIAMDLPGHGQSAWATDPSAQYRFSSIAAVIADVIAALEVKDYVLAGLSIGTNLIGEITTGFSRCKGIFLAGPALADRHIGLDKITLPFVHGAPLVMPDPSAPQLEDYCRGLVFHHDPAVLADLQRYYRQTDPAFRANLGEVLATQDWGPEITQLNNTGLPVALVYGEQEQIVSTTYLRGAITQLWRNDILLLPDAGHLVHLDAPLPFNQLLLAFAQELL